MRCVACMHANIRTSQSRVTKSEVVYDCMVGLGETCGLLELQLALEVSVYM